MRMTKKLLEGGRSLLARIQEIIVRKDFEYAELQGASIAVLWGIWFAAFGTAGHFGAVRALSVLAVEQVWGVAFLTLGVVQFVGLVKNSHRLRRASCFAAVVLWLFVSLLLGMEEYRLLAFPTTFAFAIGAAWGFIRIGRMEEGKSFLEFRCKDEEAEIDSTPASRYVKGGVRM
jgi:hypothetical protein